MSTYVVAGASRGLGFELVKQLSDNLSNVVIGLVRNVEAAKEKVVAELKRPNIHILHVDLDDYKTFPAAAAETAKITEGKLDYLIGNAAVPGDFFDLRLSEIGKDPERLDKDLTATFRTNVVGHALLINAFLPLILRGNAKKVVVMSGGMGDTELTRKYNVWMGVSGSTAKAALNMIIAKFSAEYIKQGVLFMGISPGIVDTSDKSTPPNERFLSVVPALASKLLEYEPNWKGPLAPEESIKKVLSVIEQASIENGNGGDVLSHLGNKQWV